MRVQRCYKCMKKRSVSPICKYCKDDAQKPNSPYQLAAGSILKERYFIGRAIGQGGFGITYIGWDMDSDSRIAVKEYFLSGACVRNTLASNDAIASSDAFASSDGKAPSKVTASSEVRCTDLGAQERFTSQKKRFLKEYKTLSELSGISGLVQVKDFFEENNTAYIVMEYVEGITLRQYVEKQGGKLSGRETFELLKPVMESLEKVHKAGVVHRDVSPDNLMVLEDGGVKLLDFGTVREVSDYAVSKPLTMTTESILKQGYAPLEQYQSKGSLGPWTDVYALCATACYCLTGTAPPEAIGRLLQDTPVALREAGAEVSEYEESVLQKGMALRTHDRIPDMEKLYDALFHSHEQQAGQPYQHGLVASDDYENPQEEGAFYKGLQALLFGKFWYFILLAVVVGICAGAFDYYRDRQSGDNEAIAIPLYFEEVSDDEIYDIGTWCGVGFGEVAAFSEVYTFSCSLYFPKRIFEEELGQIYLRFWMDLYVGDIVIGTIDGIYESILVCEGNQAVCLQYNRKEDTLSEDETYFTVQDVGDFYKLEVKELPYTLEMHIENYTAPIDTGRGGEIFVNLKASGAGQTMYCAFYADDIEIRGDGAVVHYFDCSAESLKEHGYFHNCEWSDGTTQHTNNPMVKPIASGF